ncbi:hypothetical protein [Burkholderia vietnamiensis]|uniref:hypothetical protein n=1 Tax=Burkholderia vietnamiensis TaxID=60552 RepID=UPI001CF5E159|nr:hypothetical protein [Burkholderia vietnamiensis]MCA8447555.1 hypothetical protein [Burkholderia vietnamiensis]
MNEIKHTREAFEAWAAREGLHLATGNCGWYLADNTAKAWKAWQECASRMNDMALALEMISDEDDAARERTKQPLLTSGVRTMLDAALIKAGRKAAPMPVRHVTIAGVNHD